MLKFGSIKSCVSNYRTTGILKDVYIGCKLFEHMGFVH